jgi:hypothetical protein
MIDKTLYTPRIIFGPDGDPIVLPEGEIVGKTKTEKAKRPEKPQDELTVRDFTDVIFDPSDPLDYASLGAGGLIGKLGLSANKIRKLVDKYNDIQKRKRKHQADIKRGEAEMKVGFESNYAADIRGGAKLQRLGKERLDKLLIEEDEILKQLPEGFQFELDLNSGGEAVSIKQALMPLKY